MDVILLDKVANLGNLGDKVNVKAGYGRNYLLPQRKATVATAANLAAHSTVSLTNRSIESHKPFSQRTADCYAASLVTQSIRSVIFWVKNNADCPSNNP